jgi:hypothetical protein
MLKAFVGAVMGLFVFLYLLSAVGHQKTGTPTEQVVLRIAAVLAAVVHALAAYLLVVG